MFARMTIVQCIIWGLYDGAKYKRSGQSLFGVIGRGTRIYKYSGRYDYWGGGGGTVWQCRFCWAECWTTRSADSNVLCICFLFLFIPPYANMESFACVHMLRAITGNDRSNKNQITVCRYIVITKRNRSYVHIPKNIAINIVSETFLSDFPMFLPAHQL